MSEKLLSTHSATELSKMIRENQVDRVDLVNELVDTINENNDKLNAVTSLWPERALKMAKEFTDKGQKFAGVPILLKGLGQSLKGQLDTGSSELLKDYVAPATNNFVKGLLNAGLIPVGETNAPEFGFKNITDSKLYGNAHNPWNTDFQPGGSSGGSAAAVGDDWLPIAAGNDGGGSIRIPSSFSGTIGLKPTRGRVPAGPGEWRGWQGASINFALTRSITDTANLLDALTTVQMAAPFQVPLPDKPFADTLNDLPKDIHIAYSTTSPVGTPVSDEAVEAVENAVKFLKDAGFDVVPADAPIDGIGLMQTYYAMNSGETATMFANMHLDDKIIKEHVEPLTWALGFTGRSVSAVQYSQALTFWDNVGSDMDEFQQEFDLYLTPTTAHQAPRIDQQLVSDENMEKMKHIEQYDPNEQLQIIWDQWLPALTLSPFTQLANISGQPAISLPTYVGKNGLPLGTQFIARKGREDLLLQIGKLFEDQKMFKFLK
ncbi:6-aminohexanoate-cyclic-dimer hydrolase [Lentilactobacillus sunkii]|jgi:amidase|uniref:6-aminohexanoate-cyclic-dimer hydrolase n=1 Tax=Lentilactobacillus sunkii TaxID=481719 RepID=A0A1E7X8H4_9LACO|nr:amidase [Lentilactobacillus sunkii]OFA09389.1 6-aminohexanoate-cyclic-dimer hydrolase [Lentilactobacillus sunkii]